MESNDKEIRTIASPQLENGFTRLANEILEALARIRTPGESRQVFDVILRKTYGFQKKVDAISLSQFVLATGINRPNIIRAIKQLISMNLIIKNDTGITCKYSINKDFVSWRPLSKKIQCIKEDNKGVSKTITGGVVNDNKGVSKTTHTKERKKDLQKKERKGEPVFRTLKPEDSFNMFYTAYPKHEARDKALKAWAKLNPDDSLLQTILQALEIAKETDNWQKDKGSFIPYPATWLNGKRWEDELPVNAGVKKATQDMLPTSPDDLLTFWEYIYPITDANFCCIAPGYENVVANAEKNVDMLSTDKEQRTPEQWGKFILTLDFVNPKPIRS